MNKIKNELEQEMILLLSNYMTKKLDVENMINHPIRIAEAVKSMVGLNLDTPPINLINYIKDNNLNISNDSKSENSNRVVNTVSIYQLEEAIKKIEALEEQVEKQAVELEKKDVELKEEKMKRAEKEDELLIAVNKIANLKKLIAVNEIAALEDENSRAQRKEENLVLAQTVKILRQVDTNYLHRNSRCTRLIFEDGSEKYMKIARGVNNNNPPK